MDRLRVLRRAARGVEAAQAKRFGSSLLSLLFRTPVLVLATTGRRTGRKRETTLAYLRLEDDHLLVVGGAGGQSRVPDWVANLRENPAVIVTVDRQTRPMEATELHGPERQVAWERASVEWPQIAKYEARAGRAVPVIQLAPRVE
jgi:deazaflavin-dependent oxidoreductase (nitroreductase family)